MTADDLYRLALSATFRPMSRTSIRITGFGQCPILCDLARYASFPDGGGVIYHTRTDWKTDPPTMRAELWAVVGTGTPRKPEWVAARLPDPVYLDMPDHTEIERDALLAALTLQ